jgi:hypothetical protein
MNWNVYPESSKFSVGGSVSFVRFIDDGEASTSPANGDQLIIEFPEGNRASGHVAQASPPQLRVSVGASRETWSLSEQSKELANGKITIIYVISRT